MAIQALPVKAAQEYKLKRDSDESMRLTTQHHVLTERQGWILHPDIQDHLKHVPNPQIADVATGNGVWAMDLAENWPNATVIGLDISPAQYPPQWTWPSNTDFDTYDLLGDETSVYEGRFDVVHIRLILPAGPSVNSAVIIESLKRLLKPGGWLQWDDLPSIPIISPVPTKVGDEFKISYEAPHPAVLALSKVAKLEERTGWFTRSDVRFVEHGFVNAKTLEVPVKPHLLKFESDLQTTVCRRWAEMLIKFGYVETLEAGVELRKLVLDMQNQFEEGGQLFSYHWFIGIASTPVC